MTDMIANSNNVDKNLFFESEIEKQFEEFDVKFAELISHREKMQQRANEPILHGLEPEDGNDEFSSYSYDDSIEAFKKAAELL